MAEVQNLTREDMVIRKFFDDTILQNMIGSHLDPLLFDDKVNSKLCELILRFNRKYKRFPSAQELVTALPNSVERNKLIFINTCKIDSMNIEFIIPLIENFFKEKQVERLLVNMSEKIHDGHVDGIENIVDDVSNAVNFSLNTNIGLDATNDIEEALKRLNTTLVAIPSSLEMIRSLTSSNGGYGGLHRKALTVYFGMPNVGKSIMLCNDAAYAYQAGYNVLYVTLEMAEEHIWERIASNVTDIPMGEIRTKTSEEIKQLFESNKLEGCESEGRIFVKELPTTATTADIENEINEIKRTKDIDIDLLVVDYIGIMKPARRPGSIKEHTLYTLINENAEQLRDLGKLHGIAVDTASQLRREGYDNKEAGMRDVAGSAGLNNTSDLIITITQDPLLKQCGLFAHMVIKNRFGPKDVPFLSQVDYTHMRVRTASQEDTNKYTDMQMNQVQEISDFNNNKRVSMGSSNVVIKNLAGHSKLKKKINVKKEDEPKEKEYITNNTVDMSVL